MLECEMMDSKADDDIITLDSTFSATDPDEESGVLDEMGTPKSSDSRKTIIFEPLITDYRTVTENDDEYLPATLDYEDPLPSTASDKESESIEKTTKWLTKFDNHFHDQHVESFSNTVWSSECGKGSSASSSNELSSPRKVFEPEFTNSTPKANSSDVVVEAEPLPEVEKCVSNWRNIFPWIIWDPISKTINCTLCQNCHLKLGSTKTVTVRSIKTGEEIFSVSKSLRDHSDTNIHRFAEVLVNKRVISLMHFFVKNHMLEFSSVPEILEAFRIMGVIMSQECLGNSIELVAVYLEEAIVEKLSKRNCKFTIVADECKGILIVRYFNGFEAAEHLIGSYMTAVTKKSPIEYLVDLGVPRRNFYGGTYGPICNNCDKCLSSANKKPVLIQTNLHFPLIDNFVAFLWRTDLLKPISSIIASIFKLFGSYAHKFIEIKDTQFLLKISQYYKNPSMFEDIYNNFTHIQSAALSIYQSNGSMEALGLINVNINNYKYMLQLGPILTTIISSMVRLRLSFFESNTNEIDENVRKLQDSCEWIKIRIDGNPCYAGSFKPENVDELVDFIKAFVDEHKNPIYSRSQSVHVSFMRLSSVKPLKECTKEHALKVCFGLMYEAVSNSNAEKFVYKQSELRTALIYFYTSNSTLEQKDTAKVMHFFRDNEAAQKQHPIVFEFFKRLSLYSFEPPPKCNRSLYVVKHYCHRIEKSTWLQIRPNLSNLILTVLCELNYSNRLCEKHVLEWWEKKCLTQ